MSKPTYQDLEATLNPIPKAVYMQNEAYNWNENNRFEKELYEDQLDNAELSDYGRRIARRFIEEYNTNLKIMAETELIINSAKQAHYDMCKANPALSDEWDANHPYPSADDLWEARAGFARDSLKCIRSENKLDKMLDEATPEVRADYEERIAESKSEMNRQTDALVERNAE